MHTKLPEELAVHFSLVLIILIHLEDKTLQANVSGVASIGARGQRAPLNSEKIVKNREKREKSGKREGKSGRKGQNREGSFTLPLLTNRAGYATTGYFVF